MKKHRQHGHDHGSAPAAPAPGPEATGSNAMAQAALGATQGAPKPAPGPVYEVVRGDNLSNIAGDLLGAPGQWRAIYELNEDASGPVREQAPAEQSGETPLEEGGMCVPPDYPHVVWLSGPELTSDDVDWARLLIKDALTRWNQPFDPSWLALHTPSPGQRDVVLAWRPGETAIATVAMRHPAHRARGCSRKCARLPVRRRAVAGTRQASNTPTFLSHTSPAPRFPAAVPAHGRTFPPGEYIQEPTNSGAWSHAVPPSSRNPRG